MKENKKIKSLNFYILLFLRYIFDLPNKIESNKIIIYEPITKMPYFSSNIEINKIFLLFK